MVRVGELADQIRGVSYAGSEAIKSPQSGYVAILRANNITDSGLLLEDFVYVPKDRVGPNQYVQKHDVLIAASSGSLDVVGKAAQAHADLGCGFGAFCKVLRPSSRIHPGYFSHFFKTADYRRRISYLAAGVNINNLRNEHLDDLDIPLPPFTEQKRIATILDRAEALRAKRRQALSKLDLLRNCIFLDLFGEAEASGWTISEVAGVAEPTNGSIRTGPFGSQLLHSEFVEEGVAVLGIDNVVNNEFRWDERRFITEAKYRELRRYTVFPGDVLITIMGTCGRCAVVPDDIPLAINTKHLCCITLDRTKCHPAFLHAYFLYHPLALRYLSRTAKGAIMSGLNMGLISAMPIPLPPINLQLEFARRTASIQFLKSKLQTFKAKLGDLLASLQHHAFRGTL